MADGKPNNSGSGPARPDRLPPHNVEAERGVLGSIMLHNDSLDEVVDILRPDQFYLDAHRLIYEAILKLRDSKVFGLDTVTVANSLNNSKQLDDIGGVTALFDIINSVPHSAHARYYAGIVRDKWVQRQLISACTDILRDCYDEAKEPDDLLASAEQQVFQILENQTAATQIDMKDILIDTFDRINTRMERGGEINGLTYGFRDLDAITNGLQATELIVFAARPSMGKTAFVCNVAEAVAENTGKGVIVFSLEQSRLELAERFLSIRAKLQVQRLRKPDFNDEERDILLNASAELSELPLMIDDAPGRTMAQIGAIARRLKRRKGLGLLVVDYLQLIEPEDKRSPREQQIAQITRRLKFMAKELEIPVIALAQLNRGVDARPDKRPRLSDLRESGAIEQDADIVMFLHRPEIYDPEDRPGEAEVVIAKHRAGPTGVVTLAFRKEFMRFEDFSGLSLPDDPFAGGTAHYGV